MVYSVDLLLLALLFIKHFFADFVFQTVRMVHEKGTYGALGGLTHSGQHALATAAILLVLTGDPMVTLIIAAAEFVAHYHIDWGKQQTNRRLGLTPENYGFWVAIGVDQLLHQATYLAIAVAVAEST